MNTLEIVPELPHLDFFYELTEDAEHYLISIFHLSGMYNSTAQGAVGFSITDIKSISDLLDCKFDTWEIEALLGMSRAYSSMLNADENTPYPFGVAMSREEFERIMNAS
jgi:hypothetical protein